VKWRRASFNFALNAKARRGAGDLQVTNAGDRPDFESTNEDRISPTARRTRSGTLSLLKGATPNLHGFRVSLGRNEWRPSRSPDGRSLSKSAILNLRFQYRDTVAARFGGPSPPARPPSRTARHRSRRSASSPTLRHSTDLMKKQLRLLRGVPARMTEKVGLCPLAARALCLRRQSACAASARPFARSSNAPKGRPRTTPRTTPNELESASADSRRTGTHVFSVDGSGADP